MHGGNIPLQCQPSTFPPKVRRGGGCMDRVCSARGVAPHRTGLVLELIDRVRCLGATPLHCSMPPARALSPHQ